MSMTRAISMYVLAALFLFFEMGIQVSPSIMTHGLMSDFHINIFWLGLMSGAYFITYTAMQIPAGLFYDRFNVKSVIIIPLVICTIGGLIFSVAPNFYVASAARIFMGFGSAFAFIGVLVVASEVFPKKHFAVVVGMTQMLAALGAMCGELPLVPLVHHFGWRITMVMVSMIGVLLIIAILLFMRLPKKNKKESSMSITKGLGLVVKNPQSWIVALYACLLWAPMAAVASLYGPPFVEKYFHVSLEMSATIIVMMWVGIAIGSPIFGFMSDKSGNRKFWLSLTAILGALAFSVLLYAPINGLSLLIILFLLAGAACAGQALSFALVRDNNNENNLATAIGFNNMAVVLAGFIFQPVVGYVIQKNSVQTAHDTSYLYSAGSYHAGMTVILGCYVVGALVAIFLIQSKHPCKN